MWWLLLGAIFGALIYYKFIKPGKFWAEQDVPHVSLWMGFVNTWNFILRKIHFLDMTADVYNKFPNERYVGFIQFGRPALLLRDLDLIKQIGVKEFDNFHDHTHIVNTDLDPMLSKSLIHLRGDKWRQMRATLSPAFTSSKMKNMYHLMVECAQNFTQHFQGKEVDVEMKELFSRFANDVIATTAFGIHVDAVNNPDHEFYTMGKALTDFKPIQAFKIFLIQMAPQILKWLGIRLFPEDLESFFSKIIKSNIRNRVQQGIVRPDLIHLMVEAQKGKLKHDNEDEKEEGFATVEESHIGKNTKQLELTDDLIVAQALIFFFAGFETVSSASCLIAYELAVNPDIQKKLQKEIDKVREKCGEKVTYEALVGMKYLDQVVCESLRLWPPAFQTDRCCTTSYTIPPKNPTERAVLIDKEMTVVFPIMAIQRDPRYFPDPDRFDPERFNDENKSKILPGSYMPFGVGPRNCIGSRFALLEMKILFFYLLSHFEIVPNEKTEIPLKVSPKKLNISPENGFQLRLKPRKFNAK